MVGHGYQVIQVAIFMRVDDVLGHIQVPAKEGLASELSFTVHSEQAVEVILTAGKVGLQYNAL